MLQVNKASQDIHLGRLLLFSPAKINLFFRVLKKREDGYHDIASLYQAISLGDEIEVSLAEEDAFLCSDPSLQGEDNLICKALALFRKKTGSTLRFHITLYKKIPVQAGLGGGSSNAATALTAFCHLACISVSQDTLMAWGAELGSDVPFFFTSGTAYAEGRGDLLQEIEPLQLPSFWIAKPNYGLSTPAVYAACRPELLLDRDPRASLQELIAGRLVCYNDLEQAAFTICPELSKVQKRLHRAGGSPIVLSGSGTAFFCFGHLQDVGNLKEELSLFQVQTVQRKGMAWQTDTL
ncbi:MAG: 4-(cytidine 5'-diphospho)-2-C-methyl-D-erythritol kinase [Chlamydiae bacterium]|nr:4-(cytidine 5'-diphospho)-2-C-methyl-D-erythritol kinase [Chlamydiota bacterium]